MLRVLVLLAALLNVALFFWIRSGPAWLQADREPQRLTHQIAASSVRVLPDLPEPSASAASAASAAQAPGAASAAAAAAASAASAVGTASAPTGVSAAPAVAASGATLTAASTLPTRADGAGATACLQSAVLTASQSQGLTRALLQAGVASASIRERHEPKPARWMVYMGRYLDPGQWQHKAEELRHLGLRFDRVDAPATLAPGLSLGSYASAAQAQQRLGEVSRHGVHSARVVQAVPALDTRRLQVLAADAPTRAALDRQGFKACPVAASAPTSTL